jgi:hypothetical protein
MPIDRLAAQMLMLTQVPLHNSIQSDQIDEIFLV